MTCSWWVSSSSSSPLGCCLQVWSQPITCLRLPHVFVWFNGSSLWRSPACRFPQLIYFLPLLCVNLLSLTSMSSFPELGPSNCWTHPWSGQLWSVQRRNLYSVLLHLFALLPQKSWRYSANFTLTARFCLFTEKKKKAVNFFDWVIFYCTSSS